MKLWFCLVGLALMALAAAPAGRNGWKPAFTADFTGGKPVDESLNIVWGQASIADGKLVVTPEQRHGTPYRRVMAVVDNYRFRKHVRLDVTASVTSEEDPASLRVALCLNSDGYPATDQIIDWTHGYLLQVGARGNTAALLMKNNRVVPATVRDHIALEAGRSYRFVAENDGGRISLTVDGRPVFSFIDDRPVTLPMDSVVGLFTYKCTLTISRLAVYTRDAADVAAAQPGRPPAGREVALRGVAVCSRSSAPALAAGDHTVRFYAYEGSDRAQATMDALLARHFPETMGVEAARRFQAQMDAQARYFIASCPLSRKDHHTVHMSAQKWAVTGVEYVRQGKRWIWPTKIEKADFPFPAPMLKPDKPLAMPAGGPILLALTDKLSLECLPIPAGRFLQGSPFYVTRWQDEFPHEVVLTRPYYMAAHPVTQEMYEAVMGSNPSKRKLARAPVEDVPYAEVARFCRILSEKNGRVVRLPTDAEWEYAARVGTSNPCLTPRYEAQNVRVSPRDPPRPVKSKAPNAWGLYDMIGAGWEADHDWTASNARVKQVDPAGPAENDPAVRDYSQGPMRKSKGGEYYGDFRPSMHGAWNKDGSGAEGVTTFRVVVEADGARRPL